MKTISAGLAQHLAGGVTTLATCWRITRRDGVVLGFTDHARELEVGRRHLQLIQELYETRNELVLELPVVMTDDEGQARDLGEPTDAGTCHILLAARSVIDH